MLVESKSLWKTTNLKFKLGTSKTFSLVLKLVASINTEHVIQPWQAVNQETLMDLQIISPDYG